MSLLLPVATRPWSKRIVRRHEPKPGKYTSYRECIRWEFGFSCAFCLLHEVDLMPAGISGWRVLQIEHADPQSRAPEKRDDYDNCFYICALCNPSRGATLNEDAEGRTLLNPCSSTWSEHFELILNELRPRLDDPDASYTWQSYDLDDRRKVILRERRKTTIEEHLGVLQETLGLEGALNDQLVAEASNLPSAALSAKLETARKVRRARELLLKNLSVYQAIPLDHPTQCVCGDRTHHTLPEVLAEQVIELPE